MDGVILITIECLRHDFLNESNAPFLYKLSKEETNFKEATVAGNATAGSTVALLTSTYPFQYGKYRGGDYFAHQDREHLARVLKKNSIRTACFVPNPMISTHHYHEEFEHIYDDLGALQGTSSNESLLKRVFYKLKKGLKKLPILRDLVKYVNKNLVYPDILRWYIEYSYLGYSPFPPAERINKEILGWLEEHKSDEFFVWVHYMEPHTPYVNSKGEFEMIRCLAKARSCPEKISKREIENLKDFYRTEIKKIDSEIRNLAKKIDEKGLSPNYIITADHGEEFFEHGGFAHNGGRMYDEVLHVPLIIKNGTQRTVKEPVSNIDIAPTILGMFDISKPDKFLGKSLLSNTRKYTFSESTAKDGKVTAIRSKEFKLIKKPKRREFYDLKKDPEEQSNLYPDSRAEKYENLLKEHEKRRLKGQEKELEGIDV